MHGTNIKLLDTNLDEPMYSLVIKAFIVHVPYKYEYLRVSEWVYGLATFSPGKERQFPFHRKLNG
jgi:hypothetical protein